MLLAYQVLQAALQQEDLLPSAMFLLLGLLTAVVYHFFPRKSRG